MMDAVNSSMKTPLEGGTSSAGTGPKAGLTTSESLRS